jgi:primosomal protein N' (replication factor Y)
MVFNQGSGLPLPCFLEQVSRMIVRVATEISADRLFDYAVPEALAPRICVGQRVAVPFGGRTVDAYVVEIEGSGFGVQGSGESSSVVQARPAPHPAAKAAAASRNGTTDSAFPEPRTLTPEPSLDLPLFSGNPESAAPARRLRSILALEDDVPYLSPPLIALARWMAEYYCAPFELTLRCALPAAVRNSDMKAKEQLFVTPAEEGAFDLTKRQAELLDGLRRVGGGWLHALTREFACTPQILKALAAKGAATIEKRRMRRDPLANRKILPSRPMSLMDEQAAALEQIFGLMGSCHRTDQSEQTDRSDPIAPKPLLLFGVTGSGKTEVYLQAIARMLEQGRGAIVLVPEIALTPQTVQRFASRFGNRIAVLHSALGEGERFDEWHRIRTGEAVVVVGPRSAVFAPVKNLGLIVVDEEHEPSYKQDETPRYNARDVAVMRGHLERCAVVLGTATPAMESWLNVEKGKYAIARLAKRVSDRPMPRVHVVDMRMEAAHAGHVQIFSGVLLEALKLRLERGEQSILFLNRRGYANALVCPKCGEAATCGECSVSYTYHQADTCLRCHICGGWKPVPDACPACGDPAFKYAGFGTQRVEIALQKCFPQAKVLRMDADVTARKHSHDELLGIFKSGRADILIGTQMIAKGLDFPNVTLVGVLSADMSLHMPDFRAAERTYQLLAQVSGRAGRAELPGEVYVQTFSPEHPAVCAAAADAGFEPFARQELSERKEGGYPPYTHLVCLTFKGESEEKVRFSAEAYARDLSAAPAGRALRAAVTVSEACPAPLTKAKGLYRYQVLLRAALTRTMTRPLRETIRQKPLPAGVSLAVDVDALSIM